MKSLMVLILFFNITVVYADVVYKCKTGQGKMQYQKTPCHQNTEEIATWTPKANVVKLSGDSIKTEKTEPIILKKGQGGHYFLSAEVNSHAITFMVDTGATIIALPKSIAKNANMFCDEKVLMRTAGGNTNGCTAIITELKLGDLSFKNVTAAIVPKLSQPLLGMNVLNHFNIEQKDGEMRLTAREDK